MAPLQMARDILVHHQVMRTELGKCHGYEVATEGDSFKCAFRTPEDAIQWCILVQVTPDCVPACPCTSSTGSPLPTCSIHIALCFVFSIPWVSGMQLYERTEMTPSAPLMLAGAPAPRLLELRAGGWRGERAGRRQYLGQLRGTQAQPERGRLPWSLG